MPEAEAIELLSVLFQPQDMIGIRPIEIYTDGTKKVTRPLWKSFKWTARPFLHQHLPVLMKVAEEEKANLFFGVCPREGGNGEYERAWQIRTVRHLWSDVDNVTVPDMVARIESAKLPPATALVNSGNGVHCYWLLAAPAVVDDVSPPPPLRRDWDSKPPRNYIPRPGGDKLYVDRQPALSPKAFAIQDVLQGLAATIEGDATFDLARILRLPGTMNRKDERNGRQPQACRLEKCDPGLVYPFADFTRLSEKSPGKERRELIAKMPLPQVKTLTPKRRDELEKKVAVCSLAPVGQRSELDFNLLCWAVECGVRKGDLWTRVQDIGKFAERGRQYFEDTWDKAEEGTRAKMYEELAPTMSAPAKWQSSAAVATPAAPTVQEADEDPHRLARLYLLACREDGVPTIRFNRRNWVKWDGKQYKELTVRDLRPSLVQCCKDEFDRLNLAEQQAGQERDAHRVTKGLIDNVIAAMEALARTAKND